MSRDEKIENVLVLLYHNHWSTSIWNAGIYWELRVMLVIHNHKFAV